MKRIKRAMIWSALFLGTIWLVMVVLLWSQHGRFIYPAPQNSAPLTPGFEDITLHTDDGLALRAFWRAPDEGRRVVMHFHGNAGSLTGASFETELLAEHGYGLLLVEYRGYGGNAGTPSEQGFYKDGRAAMAFLQERGVTPANLIISAHSIGTGTASQMALEYSPSALVLMAPFTSLQDLAASKFPFFPVRSLMRDKFDNADKVAQLEMPVLVLHGGRDGVIPFKNGERIAQLAPNGEFIFLAQDGHELSVLPHAQSAVAQWLSEQTAGELD